MIRDLALLLGIILLHVLGLIWLADATRMRVLALGQQAITRVDFTNRPKPSVAAEAMVALPAKPSSGEALVRNQKKSEVAQKTPVVQPESHADSQTLRITDSQGRIWIPQKTLDEFHGGAENKSFEVGRAGQDDMRKLLHRPEALEYRSTRFDQAWQGDKPELTKVLETAIEKTTATVRIPVPGRPGAFLQCKIMVLAAGGGCGFIANDDGSYVSPDDPNSLSPEEDKQCQAWWDLIVSAKTQGEWRRTRTLYDKECRKPLLQDQ